MAPDIEKRTVSSPHASNLDSDRFAVQELEPLLALDDDQGWFKERLYLIHILYDEITTYDHALTRPGTITRGYQRTRNPIWFQNNCVDNNQHVQVGKEDFSSAPMACLCQFGMDRRARTSSTLNRIDRIAVCCKHRSSCNASSSAW
jgi:hypothetical protein